MSTSSSLSEANAEKIKLQNLQSKVGELKTALNALKETFINCGNGLSGGGLVLEGAGADVYSFGGFSEYVNSNIVPVINSLGEASTLIGTNITKINAKINELNAQLKRELEEEKNTLKE